MAETADRPQAQDAAEWLEADGLGGAVEQALATPGPTLVEVDMKAIGEIPPYFPFNKQQPVPARA